MDIHVCGATIPSLVALSGTPVSERPSDINGPRKALSGKLEVVQIRYRLAIARREQENCSSSLGCEGACTGCLENAA